jgi:hypothetical protein
MDVGLLTRCPGYDMETEQVTPQQPVQTGPSQLP